jgi:hypothetical protein
MGIVWHEWLGPLQRVVVAIPQVRSEKKVTIASERRFTYEAAVRACHNIFPVTGDRTFEAVG